MSAEKIKSHGSFGGRVEVWRHHSEACGGLPMEFALFVPPAASEGPVPALVFLSGLTCTWENFIAKAGAQRVAAELGLMLVVPDTSPRGAGIEGEDDGWDFGTGAGFYLDATREPWDRHYNMASYITVELPEVLAAHAPIDLSRCGVTGHSMGGHGALTLGLKHPNLYKSVSALSPIVAPMQCPWGQKAFSGYLGENKSAWEAHDATWLVENGRARPDIEILIDQGLDDPFLEGQLMPERFEAACEATGQPLKLRRHAGYDHGYYFVATVIEDHLRHCAGAVGLC